MDNSASMFSDDTKMEKIYEILGAWAKSTAKTYPEDGTTHNIILARFSGRLQIEAKIEITNGNIDYYSFNGPQENWHLTNKKSSVRITKLYLLLARVIQVENRSLGNRPKVLRRCL